MPPLDPLQDVIRSAANPRVKRARAAGAGREEGVVLLEGRRLVADALEAGWAVELVLVAEGAAFEAGAGAESCRVAADVLARVSTLKGAPDVLALARTPAARPLDALPARADGLLVVAGGVQDPGNLGALARAAEAAAASGLVVTGGGASPFGAKALRGSMGSRLRLAVAHEPDAAACARALAAAGWRQALTAARDGADHAAFDWQGPLALWLTAESGRLPDGLDAVVHDFERVTIRMAPGVESLNVATAAAVLLFSAGRVARAEPPPAPR